MDIRLKYEEFETESGQTMFIEKYQEKYSNVPYWRYGTVYTDKEGRRWATTYSAYLLSKPNKKRLIETY